MPGTLISKNKNPIYRGYSHGLLLQNAKHCDWLSKAIFKLMFFFALTFLFYFLN